MYQFNDYDIQQQVIDFMHSQGIFPYDDNLPLQLDGRIHRFRLQHEHAGDKGGAYCIFTDFWPAGFIQDWHNGGGSIKWSFPRDKLNDEGKSYFDEERYKQVKKQSEEKQQQKIRENDEKQIEAAELARIHFEHAAPANPAHNYLKNKNVPVLGLHEDNGDLLVPMRNADGSFRTFQRINPDGTKRFFPGAPKKGAFYSVALDCIKPESPILIAEGYATMATIYELTGYPCVAAMDCGNIYPVAEALKAKYPDNKIIIMADNDSRTDGNPGISKANEARDKLNLQAVVYPDFKKNDNGSDWNDYCSLYGNAKSARILLYKIKIALLPKDKQEIFSKVEISNAEDLRHEVFEPVKWAVEGFLPSGLAILAGSPKIGKSILSLHIAIGVAVGGCVLGKINVEQGDVLYLALEDNKRRLQDRMNFSDFFSGDFYHSDEYVTLEHLDIIHRIPRQHEGGLDFIEWWLSEHPDARLVIIDTLQKFRKLLSGKGSMYAEDYETISQIKALADKWEVPFLIIHHLKKAKEQDDWLNEFSGSQGIAGSADTLFALKRTRTDNHAILHRTGRDVEEKDFSMRLDRFGWVLEGEAELFTMPEWKRQIMDYLKEHETVSPMQLAQDLNLNINTAKSNILRLVKDGTLKKVGHGTYTLNG